MTETMLLSMLVKMRKKKMTIDADIANDNDPDEDGYHGESMQ